ncbi:MAG: DUF4340 domain-containing protein [Evtepia sp.]|nr:DUF4340 domain-containing protein [Evtepia sp.]MDY3013996.1 DUF4340 domain-containing protein [Evtepia sp.]
MTRSKKLTVLLVVFAVVCLVTFFVSRHQAEKEAIASTDTVILSVDPAAVDSLSWTCGESDFSFHKEDGTWTYDADPDFPVSQEAIENQLQVFQSFAAAFTIEQPEDLGQYGLDEPECTITLTAGGQTYTVTAGDYSAMDSQRYVSLGDGNVYLVQRDPVTTFDVGLADLIAHDRVPALEEVNRAGLHWGVGIHGGLPAGGGGKLPGGRRLLYEAGRELDAPGYGTGEVLSWRVGVCYAHGLCDLRCHRGRGGSLWSDQP